MTVGVPTPGDGIGRALRSAYRPKANDLPDDMLALLEKLDRH